MTDIDLGLLAQGPHAGLIRDIAARCAADEGIQAIWVGGSLASGTGDRYSDVDFRLAVEPGQLERWTSPDWHRYLPLLPSGGLLLRFGERALLHHLVLHDGTIVDFYVQDTVQQNPEPSVVILMCRSTELRTKLEAFARPAAAMVRAIDAAVAAQFFVDYWIMTHKHAKAFARRFDLSPFSGLNLERMALLRAWFMQAVGKDIDARPTLHMLGVLHQGLAGKVSEQQRAVLGSPSQTPLETATVIETVRAEMARVGRVLAERHGFEYPSALEGVVQQFWSEHKDAVTRR